MQTGRPAKEPRPPFGAHLHALRERAGLSQEQLADKLGIAQRTYSHWERYPVALRHDQLVSLADALGISTAELVGGTPPPKRGNGPVGRTKRLFDSISRLPRNQQEKVISILEPFVRAHVGHSS